MNARTLINHLAAEGDYFSKRYGTPEDEIRRKQAELASRRKRQLSARPPGHATQLLKQRSDQDAKDYVTRLKDEKNESLESGRIDGYKVEIKSHPQTGESFISSMTGLAKLPSKANGPTCLVEALCTAQKANKSDELQRNLVQYVKSGNTYKPIGNATLVDALGPCAFNIESTMEGIVFERVKPKTDEMLVFEDSYMNKVVLEIDKFWERKEHYNRLGLMHSRGILMHGPPGSGKSIALQQVVEMMSNRGDVVFFAKSTHAVCEGLKAFREVEPARRVVICFEEADELVRYDERGLLQLMDGDAKTDNVLFLATTNYLDRLPPRILRPGRFDKKIYIGPPSMESRLKYLSHKLKGLAEDADIQRMAEQSDGFGFGHLRELIAGVYAMGEPINDVIQRLKAPITESRKRPSSIIAVLG